MKMQTLYTVWVGVLLATMAFGAWVNPAAANDGGFLAALDKANYNYVYSHSNNTITFFHNPKNGIDGICEIFRKNHVNPRVLFSFENPNVSPTVTGNRMISVPKGCVK